MSLVLYQIGDVPLYHSLKGVNDEAVKLDVASRWRTPSTDFTDVGGDYSFLPLTHSIPDAKEIDISGTLVTGKGMSAGQVLERLKFIGGRRNTPVIAFTLENYTGEDGCGESCASSVRWLLNECVIDEVSPRYETRSEGTSFNFDVIPVDITMRLGTIWRGLTPWFWEYRPWNERIINPFSSQNMQVSIDNRFLMPKALDQLQENAYFYRWQSELSDFNTSFWAIAHEVDYPAGVGADYQAFGQTEFYSDPFRWSAPPRSFYAFRGVNIEGSISLTVTRAIGYFQGQGIQEQSTLDLAQLSLDMETLGYGELQAADEIFTGLAHPFPGFVKRNGVILDGVRPRWDYPGTYPGETGQGYNIVRVDGINTAGQFAYLHDYGVF